jgi:hypothetical protein
VDVQRATKLRIVEFTAPFFLGIGFIVKMLNKVAFAWWLDPRLQRNENRALWDDVQANLFFLVSEAQLVNSRPVAVLPFDYASVKLLRENVLFTITRGRGDLTVSVGPRHLPAESYELGSVMAALERRHLSERDLVNDFAGVERLLGPRLQVLNAAFSEEEYPRIKTRL